MPEEPCPKCYGTGEQVVRATSFAICTNDNPCPECKGLRVISKPGVENSHEEPERDTVETYKETAI